MKGEGKEVEVESPGPVRSGQRATRYEQRGYVVERLSNFSSQDCSHHALWWAEQIVLSCC